MTDPDRALERIAVELGLKVAQLALGAPPRQAAAFERRDTCGVVAAIFEAPERIDELYRDRLTAEDADNSTHPARFPVLSGGDNTPETVYSA